MEIEAALRMTGRDGRNTPAYPPDERRQSVHGGLRLGANPSIPDPGSRWCIRRDIYPPRSIDRHSRPPDVSAFTLAKRIRRTVDRLDPQGMPRSYRGVRRTPSAPCAAVLHGLL